MADEGPTTVGSIDAKVGMDLDQWRADVAYLKSSAEEIGAIRPSITVDANTSRAEEQMAAVDAAAAAMGVSAQTSAARVSASADDVAAAEAKVAAANQAADTAYARAELAQQRLTEAQESGRTKASSLMAAEIALSEALNRLDTANAKATASEAALVEAQQKAATSAVEEGAAEEGKASAISKSANASKSSMGYMQLIIAAVVTLIGLAGPLSAAAAGIGGAFAGMGAAGALAIVGVISQIKQGTAAGQAWSAGLQDLKGDLNDLGNTAANGLLAYFQQAVTYIHEAMPDLNSEISTFTSLLGQAGTQGVQGLINLFRIANPLLVQGGVLIDNIAAGFTQWTQNGGLQQFVTYAEQELPHVVDTIGDVGSMIIHVVEAAAPIGSTVLTAVDQFSQAIDGIPVPVLTAAATAALSIWAAFKLGNGVGSIINSVTGYMQRLTGAETDASGAAVKLGTSIGSAVGWVGVAAAAIGIAVTAVDSWKQAVEQAAASDEKLQNSIVTGTDAAGGFSDAMKQVNAWNDTGKTTTEQMANALNAASAGWGLMDQTISQSPIVSTFEAQANASGNVLTMLNQYGDSLATVARTDLPAAVTAFQKFSDQYDLNSTQQWRAINNMGQYKTVLTQQATEWGYAATQGNLLAIATGQITGANPAATDSTDKLANAENGLAASQQLVKTYTDAAAQAITAFGQANRTADQANISYQQSLDQASQSIKQNGRTLDESTAAGRSNASALDQIATSGLALIAAQTEQGVSETTLQGHMATTRSDFIKTAEQMGDNKSQAEKLADQYGLVPSNITTAFKQTGLGDAIENVNTYEAAIQQLLSDQKAVQLGGSVAGYYGFRASGGTAGKPGKAAGGTIGMAPGGTVSGFGNSVNDLAGLYRLADGEEILSNMGGQADKWRSVVKMMNAGDAPAQIAGKTMQVAGVAPTPAPAPVVVNLPDAGPVVLDVASMSVLAGMIASKLAPIVRQQSRQGAVVAV